MAKSVRLGNARIKCLVPGTRTAPMAKSVRLGEEGVAEVMAAVEAVMAAVVVAMVEVEEEEETF